MKNIIINHLIDFLTAPKKKALFIAGGVLLLFLIIVLFIFHRPPPPDLKESEPEDVMDFLASSHFARMPIEKRCELLEQVEAKARKMGVPPGEREKYINNLSPGQKRQFKRNMMDMQQHRISLFFKKPKEKQKEIIKDMVKNPDKYPMMGEQLKRMSGEMGKDNADASDQKPTETPGSENIEVLRTNLEEMSSEQRAERNSFFSLLKEEMGK